MSQRYYFLVRYTNANADYDLLAGRCISQMHLFMVNHHQAMNRVGVSFPDWNESSVGQTIAFVSEDKEMMIGLSFQPYFSLMVKEGLFEISSVYRVPSTVVEVRFVRNQTIGKNFLGSKKRRIKRSMARAELTGDELSLPVTNEDRIIDSFHRIPITSGSSEQDFILFIQKEFADERAECGFNSYGFATNQDKRATVPDLRFAHLFEHPVLVK